MAAGRAFLAWAALLAPWATADAAPLALKASSPWNMDYAADSCRLQRSFGEDKDKVYIRIERFAPTEHFALTLFGKPLRVDAVTMPVTVAFGPNGIADKREQAPAGSSGEKDTLPLVIVESTGLFGKPSQPPYLDQAATPEAERAITELLVDQRAAKDLLLLIGPMDKPMAAMRACTDELLDHWGLDPAVQRTLTSRATPLTNPGTWLKSADYPRAPLNDGESAVVRIRLTVGPTGLPTDCAVQSATLGPKFAEATCALLKTRARFSPARDKDGKPTASYYTTTVSWIVH